MSLSGVVVDGTSILVPMRGTDFSVTYAPHALAKSDESNDFFYCRSALSQSSILKGKSWSSSPTWFSSGRNRNIVKLCRPR